MLSSVFAEGFLRRQFSRKLEKIRRWMKGRADSRCFCTTFKCDWLIDSRDTDFGLICGVNGVYVLFVELVDRCVAR